MSLSVISASSPVWANKSKTAVTLQVFFGSFDTPVPFTASNNDVEKHGRDLFQKAINGEFGEIGDFLEIDKKSVFSVSMRQARLALLQKGLLSQIQTAISSLESPMKEAAQIEWEYSTEVDRDSHLVKMLSPALGLTEMQLDELFNLAATL